VCDRACKKLFFRCGPQESKPDAVDVGKFEEEALRAASVSAQHGSVKICSWSTRELRMFAASYASGWLGLAEGYFQTA
jgi:hypothetical protein